MIAILWLFLLFLLALAWGEKIFDRIGAKTETILERYLFSLGLGLASFAYFVYLLGLLKILYRPVIYLFLAGSFVYLARKLFSYPKMFSFELREFKKSTSRGFFSSLLVVFILLQIFFNLIGALAPEIGFDALWYHLALPKIYLTLHRLFLVPYIEPAGYPRLMEMLYTLALALRGDILAKLIHYSMGIVSLLAVYSLARKFFSQSLAVVAGAVFYGMQPINMLSATANIDLGLTFFQILAVYALANWLYFKERRWLWLTAILTGISMAVKYHGGLFSLVLVLALISAHFFGLKERNLAKLVKEIVIFSVIAFLVASPWYLDNFIRTGNPTYPLFGSLFGQTNTWEQIDIGSHRPGGWFAGHNWQGFLILPWKLTMGYCDGWASPLFLLFFPLILLAKDKSAIFKQGLFFAGLLFAVYFLLPYWIVRFFVPLFPILSILTAYLWESISQFDTYLKRVTSTAIIIVLTANLGLAYFKNAPALPVALGLQSRQDYLKETLGWYGVNQFIDQIAPKPGKILVYGAQLFYYFDFDYIYSETFQASSYRELASKLKKRKISHILLLYDSRQTDELSEISRLAVTRDEASNQKELQRCFRLIYFRKMPEKVRVNTARGVKLYAIEG